MYYVYALIDPRDNEIFYIGKGKRNRMHTHLDDAKRGRIRNIKKHNRIIAILDDGLAPIARKLQEFRCEESAFEAEIKLISELPNLTNMTAGGEGRSLPPELMKAREEELLLEKTKKAMAYFKKVLGMVASWPGTAAFPYMQDGDRMAEDLISYMKERVLAWEATPQGGNL